MQSEFYTFADQNLKWKIYKLTLVNAYYTAISKKG